MENNQMKNIVILKDLPSNIVEEAIIVLKQNRTVKIPKITTEEAKNLRKHKDNVPSKPDNSKDYILREAEMVISSYISNIEEYKAKKTRTNTKLEKKYKRLKYVTFALSVFTFINLLIKII